MEPFDFDEIVRQRLNEDIDLHQHEIESSKPFVWSAIQDKIRMSRTLKWYHLAAAVVILLISFSFILINVQQGHNREMQLLSDKVDDIRINYESQGELIRAKELQVLNLTNELEDVEIQLTDLQNTDPVVTERIVYQVDTIYMKEIEYITVATELPPEETQSPDNQDIVENQTEIETDLEIFPTFYTRRTEPPGENLKVKFGPFSSKKN